MARPVPNDAASLNILQNIEQQIEHSNSKLEAVCSYLVNIEDAISNMVVSELQKQTELLTNLVSVFTNTPISGAAGGNIDSEYEVEHVDSLQDMKKYLDKIEDNTDAGTAWYQFEFLQAYRKRKFDRKYMFGKWNWFNHTKKVRFYLDQMTDALHDIRNQGRGRGRGRGRGGDDDVKLTPKTGRAIYDAFRGMAKYLNATRWVRSSTKVLKLTDSLVKAIDKLSKRASKIRKLGRGLKELGTGILTFGITMTLAAPFLITAIPGIFAAKLAIITLTWALGKQLTDKKLKKMIRNVRGLGRIGRELLVFGFNMTLALPFLLLAVPAALLAGLAVATFVLMFKLVNANWKSIRSGAKALRRVSKSILLLGATMVLVALAAPMIITALPIVVSMIFTIGILFSLVGALNKLVRQGAISMLIASGAIIALSIGMAIWIKSGMVGKQGWETFAMVSATLTTIGLLMAGAGYLSPFIALGAIAMLLSGVAIIALSYGLMIFKKVEWSGKDSELLAKTVTDILAAMRGKSPGDGKDADFGEGLVGLAISLMNAGVLIVAAVSIILLSIALKQFKDVGWTDDDNTLLGETIAGVLESLSNPGGSDRSMGQTILDTALSLISAGVLFVAGIAILVFSAALAAFKAVGWTDGDRILLGDTISGVLAALSEKGEDKSMLEGFLETALAMMSAGVLIVASVAILLFSGALAAFKAVGWTEEDNKILGATINGVLGALGDPGGVGETDSSIGILGLIMALLSAGTIFVISGAVWLFGSALKQFKDVGWTDADNKSLKATIKGVTSVIHSLNDLDIDDDVLDIMEDIADPLETFSLALQEYKKANMTYDDMHILKGTVGGLVKIFSKKNAEKAVNLFGVFSGHIIDLADYVSDIEDLAEAFESIAESMQIIKEEINDTDLEKLTEYRNIVYDLGVLMEKTQDKSLSDIVGGISDAIANFNPFSGSDEEDNSKVPVSAEQAKMDTESIIQALNQLIGEIQSVDNKLSGVLVVKNEENPFS